MKSATVAFNLPELASIQGGKIIGKNLKLGKQIELEILGKGTHFRSARGIEDDLKHAVHNSGKESEGKHGIIPA